MDHRYGRLPGGPSHVTNSVRAIAPRRDVGGQQGLIDQSRGRVLQPAGRDPRASVENFHRPAVYDGLPHASPTRRVGPQLDGAVLPPVRNDVQGYTGQSSQDGLPPYGMNAVRDPQAELNRNAFAKTQSLPRLWEVVGPPENLVPRPQEIVRSASPPKLRVPLSPVPTSRTNQPITRKRKSDDFAEMPQKQPLAAEISHSSFPHQAAMEARTAGPEPPRDPEPAFKRSRQSGDSITLSTADTGSAGAGASREPAKADNPALDVSGVHLPGEDTKSVPVYDTCDTIRRKIAAFLKKPGITQAAFLRAIARTWNDGRKLQGAQLNRFLNHLSGPRSGNTSGVFYAAYVFFEKVRIRDGHPKSADRLDMEKIYPEGMNTTELQNYVTVMRGETVTEDKFGRLHFEKH